jgi:Family of unknown function (DUF6345)
MRYKQGNSSFDRGDLTDVNLDSAGHDQNEGDDSDLVWEQSHGNFNGLRTGKVLSVGPPPFFPITYDRVTSNRVQWGDGDLEWIVMHACDTLADLNESGAIPTPTTGITSRWVQSFAGVHLLMGFRNHSANVDGDADEFADNIVDDHMRVVDAFVDAVEDEQPSGVKYRIIGPRTASNVNNFSDHAWGLGGGTTQDIKLVGTAYWNLKGTV